jgi:cell division transport system ATP-binding protein
MKKVSETGVIQFSKVGLQFEGGPKLFHDLDLLLPAKSFHFLTGPSGAGKSTLLKMLYLDCYPTTGTVKIFGKNTRTLEGDAAAIFRRKVGVVFQDFRLINHLTALENVALPLKVEGIDVKKRTHQAAELLEWVGLKDFIDVKPSLMSGGQQQRIAIARAVVNRPKLLLADEPTGNVDDQIATRLLYLFEELYKSGTTVVVATHNRALAHAFPYPEITLKDGKIEFPPRPLLQEPQTQETHK